jgi:uncharacterized protein (DUF488 family)
MRIVMSQESHALHASETRTGDSMPLLTIGYGSKRSLEEFVELLRRYGVKYLVDVRTNPHSAFRPEFSREAIGATLGKHEIVYVFMGETLGGRPTDPSCYTAGKVDYAKVRQQEWFARGLERLQAGWRSGQRIAVMCAELEPDRCHRSKLIGEALVAGGVAVAHIGEAGAVIPHDAAMTRLTGGQGSLFELGYASRRACQANADEGGE